MVFFLFFILILLNLLVNSHLPRNALAIFLFELIYMLLSVKQRKRYREVLVFQPNQSECTVELVMLVRHTVRQKKKICSHS